MNDDAAPPPETDRLLKQKVQTALNQVPLMAGQTVVIARGPQVLVHRGDLKPIEAQDIAVQVAEGWHDRGQTVRIQFMRLPLLAEERLLYTSTLAAGYFLTVVDGADAPLTRVAGLARQLQPLLEQAGLAGYNPAP